MLTISSVFATRDFLRMTSNDGHTLVRLIISNPERMVMGVEKGAS